MINNLKIGWQIIKRQIILRTKIVSPTIASYFVNRTALLQAYRQGDIADVALELIWPNRVGNVLREQPLTDDIQYDITVILPAYNVEKFVAAALTSVLRQEIDADVEVLVIDDESTDRTMQIIEETLATVTTRHHVEVIKKQNAGISAARNTAIAMAKGRYIFCIDADDYIDKQTLMKLYNKAENASLDMVQCRTESFFQGRSKEMHTEKTGMSGYPWGKLMRRSVWADVQFPENALFEDSVFKYLILPRVTKIGFDDTVSYHYRINPKGLNVQSKVNLNVIDTVYVMEKMLKAQLTLGIPVNETTFDDYLEQMRLNARRVELMDCETQFAIFKRAQLFLTELERHVNLHGEQEHQNLALHGAITNHDFDDYICQTVWRI